MKLLRYLGLLEDFSADDMINASTEDAARAHGAIVQQLHDVIRRRERGNEALRHSISKAKVRANRSRI